MTERQECLKYIKEMYPIGTEVWDDVRSQPMTIRKSSVFIVRIWKPEDYNDQMRPSEDKDYFVDFLVKAQGRNAPIYSLEFASKRNILEKYKS